MSAVADILDVIDPLLRRLVDSPDELRVELVQEGAIYTLQVTVTPRDIGKLIGTQGRTARAIRVLLQALASAKQVSLHFDLRVSTEDRAYSRDADGELSGAPEAL